MHVCVCLLLSRGKSRLPCSIVHPRVCIVYSAKCKESTVKPLYNSLIGPCKTGPYN